MRSDYLPTKPILSLKPVGLCKAPYDEPRRSMQGNKVNIGKKWELSNNTPVVPAGITVSGGLSADAPGSLVTRKIVATDEGPIAVATISETLDRVVTSSDLDAVVKLDSRKLNYQPTLELK